jgi:SAM-dependent methyltransferase
MTALPAGAQRAPLGAFLRRNPFPRPLTLGFFYREKMRAIHRIAPDGPVSDVLEVGGGQGGVASLLYPGARITNVDLDPALGQSPVNRARDVRFVCGDATTLPFADASFDVATMFDVLEHVPAHDRAAAEALRVLRPGGWLLASSPNDRWRFPYYAPLKPICPSEEAMFAEWGHVRRGYSADEFQQLIGARADKRADFITPLTVICHDVAFSRLSERVRRAICVALAPLTWTAYALHDGAGGGTETAMAWRKPA